ncbi:MAG: hypothetical protein K0B05_08250 [Bacteroidales bacterium]|nr:hypothetical protein [Bacteroidales bacterium]
MNNIIRISFRLLMLAVLFAGIITGCRSGDRKTSREEGPIHSMQDHAAIYEDIQKAEKIFQALPSPLESAMLIKSAGAQFNEKLLNPVENTRNYLTNKSMALNLGIYTCNLSFVSLYDQTQLIINYMNAAKKMADGLGILDAIEEETINRLEENINNREAIMDIVAETFMNSNSYLEENGQPAIAAIVLAGGWMEGLYISTQLVDMKDFDGNRLVGRIIDQKLSIGILLSLLENSKGNPAIDELIEQITRVKLVFDKINLSTSPVRPEYDNTANVTVLKSQVKSDMTPQIFGELATLVAEIRSTFVK